MEIRNVIFLLGLLFLPATLTGQSPERGKSAHKLGASFFEEHINLPFRARLGEERHYGGSLDYEISKPRAGLFQFSHQFHLGYFRHQHFFRAFFLGYRPTFSLLFRELVQLDLPLGIAYAHSFSTEQGYVLTNGTYEKSRSGGKPHLMPSLGLGLRLKLDKFLSLPLEIFSRYEVFALLPYAPEGSLPFTPHTALTFGLKYRWK